MAEHRSTAALAAAKRLFKRKPDASTEEFRKVCERADPDSIRKLDNREFNASYVLPFKRSAALRGKPGPKRGKKKKKKAASAAARKTTKKRAPKNGRRKGRKKAKRTTAGRAAAGADTGTVQRVAQMLRERDAELLAAASDLHKVYDIAAHVEAFAAEVIEASKS